MKLLFRDNSLKDKKLTNLNPWLINGFSDAECSFQIKIREDSRYKLDWHPRAQFEIHLHSRDLPLLNKIQCFFGGIGSITLKSNRDEIYYTVIKLDDLVNVIIPLF
jgi:LAGLIDADG endonuclease